MKYESAILKRLIDTYGVVGNPKYISEIIKEFIVQGKECYPNLFTYQSDWLAHIDEFGLSPSYTVSYTGQSIYAPNTLEKPVKSAILKGSTKYRDIDTGEILEAFEEGRNLELVSVKMPVLKTNGKNLFDGEFILGKINDDGTNSEIKSMARSKNYIEVKPNTTYNYKWIQMLGASRIFFYDNNKQFISKGDSIPNSGGNFTTPNNCKYIHFHLGHANNFGSDTVQIEQGTTTTSYEPYKSNILTVNEDVTLRGIGEVRDTLDCLTGEVVERVGETRFNGDFSWELREVGESYTTFRLAKTSISSNMVTTNSHNRPTDYVCNALNVVSSNNGAGEFECIWFSDGHIYIRLSKDKATTIDGLKQYLNFNDITIQYLLKNEFIKTVDLTILDQNGRNVKQLMSFNGGTHFITGSLGGTPLPSVSVSVETDLEETLAVCSLEGNTM